VDKKIRPKSLPSITRKAKIECGTLYITLGFEGDKPFECFIRLGKIGSCGAAMMGSIGKIIGITLNNNGESLDDVIESLEHTRCTSPSIDDGEMYSSCCDAIAKCLREMMESYKKSLKERDIKSESI